VVKEQPGKLRRPSARELPFPGARNQVAFALLGLSPVRRFKGLADALAVDGEITVVDPMSLVDHVRFPRFR
jgi:hypothetical protein